MCFLSVFCLNFLICFILWSKSCLCPFYLSCFDIFCWLCSNRSCYEKKKKRKTRDKKEKKQIRLLFCCVRDVYFIRIYCILFCYFVCLVISFVYVLFKYILLEFFDSFCFVVKCRCNWSIWFFIYLYLYIFHKIHACAGVKKKKLHSSLYSFAVCNTSRTF